MSQQDELQGKIASFRYALNITVTVIFACVGLLIVDYRSNNFDSITIVTFFVAVASFVVAVFIQKTINKKLEEVGKL